LSFRHYLNRLRLLVRRGRTARRPAISRLYLESLEERDVPTIVFSPQFGNETTIIHTNGQTLHTPPVELIFWGWNDPQNPPGPSWPTPADITDAATKVLASPYLGGLTPYRTDGMAHLDRVVSARSDSPNPDPRKPFDPETLREVVTNLIDHGNLPEPDAGSMPIYVVVTPPNISSVTAAAAGWHTWGRTGSLFDADSAPLAWVGTSPPGLDISFQAFLDGFTATFGHEVAEAMTDPNRSGSSGTTVVPGAPFVRQFPRQAENEIADNEPALRYFYRLGGALVTAYWSPTPHIDLPQGAYVVPDGNQAEFDLIPVWNGTDFTHTYTLTVHGDQFGVSDDTITVRAVGGGVSVILNGATATFDPGVIAGITILPGGGSNTIDVQETLPGAPVTITDSDGTDTVTVEQTAATAPVTISAGTGTTAVTVSSVTHALDPIQGDVVVNNLLGGTATLTVNDQGLQDQARYLVEGDSVTRTDVAAQTTTTTIRYAGVNVINLNGGSGPSIFDVGDTEGPGTTAITTGGPIDQVNVFRTTGDLTVGLGAGTDTVSLSPMVGTLDGILGNVTVNGGAGPDTLVANDSGHLVFGRTYDLQSGTLRVEGAPAQIQYTGIGTVELDTAQGMGLFTDTINVRGPVAGAMLIVRGADANDRLVVDFAAGNPIPSLGLSFDGGAGTNSLILQNDPFGTLTDNPATTNAGSLTLRACY
jgi:hypothetical protein